MHHQYNYFFINIVSEYGDVEKTWDVIVLTIHWVVSNRHMLSVKVIYCEISFLQKYGQGLTYIHVVIFPLKNDCDNDDDVIRGPWE